MNQEASPLDDILTVPDSREALVRRFDRLFPYGKSSSEDRDMFEILDDGDLSGHWRCRPDHKNPEPVSEETSVALCGRCFQWVPWIDVLSGRSVRAWIVGEDLRLCATCTKEHGAVAS